MIWFVLGSLVGSAVTVWVMLKLFYIDPVELVRKTFKGKVD